MALMSVEDRLAEAKQALHQLQVGRAEVEVSYDGSVVKYARAEIPALKAYISQLEAERDGRPSRGALRIGF